MQDAKEERNGKEKRQRHVGGVKTPRKEKRRENKRFHPSAPQGGRGSQDGLCSLSPPPSPPTTYTKTVILCKLSPGTRWAAVIHLIRTAAPFMVSLDMAPKICYNKLAANGMFFFS